MQVATNFVVVTGISGLLGPYVAEQMMRYPNTRVIGVYCSHPPTFPFPSANLLCIDLAAPDGAAVLTWEVEKLQGEIGRAHV